MIPVYALAAMHSPILLSASTPAPETVSTTTIMDILSAVTGVFSVSQIVAMIAGLLGVSMTFIFLWWGVRKGARIIIAAVKSGKFKI